MLASVGPSHEKRTFDKVEPLREFLCDSAENSLFGGELDFVAALARADIGRIQFTGKFLHSGDRCIAI